MSKRKKKSALLLCSDQDIMALVKEGERAPFAELVRRHQESLLNYFWRMGVYTDTEDLVQETFIRLFRARTNYRPVAKFTTFLYRIARTVWIDWYRKKMRREEFFADYELALEEQIAQRVGASELETEVQMAVEALPEKLRVVVVMSVYMGFKYQEIADVLEVPLGTVKSRMNLAMARLREYMHVHVGGRSISE